MIELLNKIFHKLKTFFVMSIPKSLREKNLQNKIKNGIISLNKISLETENQWEMYRRKLRERIAAKDLRNFLNWDIIRSSMFCEAGAQVFEYLRSRPYWPEWRKSLKTFKAGLPRRSPYLFSSNGNLLHNAYLIARLKDFSSFAIDNAENVLEFGGGYGAMGYIFRKFGYSGRYTIYDLPEFSFLQEYFFTSEMVSDKINLIYKLEDLEKEFNNGCGMFIAAWSISETPMSFRDKIFKIAGLPKYYLIAYRDQFWDNNNLEYFKKFMSDRPNYAWSNTQLEHLPNNYLLVGVKKD